MATHEDIEQRLRDIAAQWQAPLAVTYLVKWWAGLARRPGRGAHRVDLRREGKAFVGRFVMRFEGFGSIEYQHDARTADELIDFPFKVHPQAAVSRGIFSDVMCDAGGSRQFIIELPESKSFCLAQGTGSRHEQFWALLLDDEPARVHDYGDGRNPHWGLTAPALNQLSDTLDREFLFSELSSVLIDALDTLQFRPGALVSGAD